MDRSKSLLDTDILSAIMRQDPKALSSARRYLKSHDCLSISLITRYEILRGLKAKNATRQIEAFDTFCRRTEIYALDDAMVKRAASIYAELRQAGRLIGDADILIAATAIEEGLSLVTNNESHFTRVSGLAVRNWLVD